MDWLYDNPVARMGSLAFHALYWGCVVLAIIVVRVVRSRVRCDKGFTPLQIPEQINPYQIAFLRGGENEVARTAALELVELGRLVELPSQASGGKAKTQPLQWKVANALDTGAELPPLQRTILQAFKAPAEPTAVFGPDLAPVLREQTQPFREWMEVEGLGEKREPSPLVPNLVTGLLVGLFGLGLYKLYAASYLELDYVTVPLVASMFATLVAVVGAGLRGRLSPRGKKFLKDIQGIYGPLWSLKDAAANDEKVRPGLGGASMALMAMGIFGVRALHDSALNSVFLAYQKAGGNRVGCGGGGSAGCGSTAADSGSSCGGGCSGDGGGGCGGGCGGCGGD